MADLPTVFAAIDSAPAAEHPELVASPVAAALHWVPDARVFEIDPNLADTAALSDALRIPLDRSANCVIISGRRADAERSCACLALATTKVDVNSVVRRRLDVRKASFAPMDQALELTGMEYGGITPVGLPTTLPLWIDRRVVETDWVLVGGGNRSAKLLLPGPALAALPNAEVLDGLAK